MIHQLEKAWKFREELGVFSKSDVVRVFHGPGESNGEGEEGSDLREIAIDRFGDHYWVTEWKELSNAAPIAKFLESKGAKSAVRLYRPPQGVPGNPEIILGEPPEDRFEVREGKAKYWIHLLGVKHPGLFLDHAPLREWLQKNSKGLRVLNTFAYTGSLSIAAGLGGAKKVTTLDLSKPTIEWARENWKLNKLPEKAGDFIFGDTFEWVPKLAKKSKFDCVIVDPPSFSRGKKGNFSTAKDLTRLHAVALEALEPGGLLITSINSANISRKKYFWEVQEAAKSLKRKLEIIQEIELPQTFPTRTSSEADRYLKGWILKCP